jgi:hypothetical protein
MKIKTVPKTTYFITKSPEEIALLLFLVGQYEGMFSSNCDPTLFVRRMSGCWREGIENIFSYYPSTKNLVWHSCGTDVNVDGVFPHIKLNKTLPTPENIISVLNNNNNNNKKDQYENIQVPETFESVEQFRTWAQSVEKCIEYS